MRISTGDGDVYLPLTGGAEMILGGGDGARGRWAVFGRFGVALGVAPSSASSDYESFFGFAWRVGGGIGGHYRVNDRVSLGGYLDVGTAYVAGDLDLPLWVNPSVSVAVHFGTY